MVSPCRRQRTTGRTLTALLQPGNLICVFGGDLAGRSLEVQIAHILRKHTGGDGDFHRGRRGAVATENQSAATRYGSSVIRAEATPASY